MSSNLSLWRTASRQIRTPANQQISTRKAIVCFSSSSSSSDEKKGMFRPRRPSTYRQDWKSKRFSFLQPKASNNSNTIEDKDSLTDFNNTAEWQRDPEEFIDFVREMKDNNDMTAESSMRLMDFFTAARGSTEDLVGRRRALMHDEDPDAILQELKRISQQELFENDFKLGDEDATQKSTDNDNDEDEDEMDDGSDPNQLAYGPWYVLQIPIILHY